MPRLPLLILLALLLPSPGALPAVSEDEAALARLEADIARLRQQIDDDGGTKAREAQALLDAERQIDSLAGTIADLSSRVASEQAELDRLRREEAAFASRLESQRELISQYLRSAWLGGRQEYLKLLLNQDDPATASRLRRYYLYFSEARASRIEEYRSVLNRLAALKAGILMASDRLEREKRELAARQAELEEGQSRRLALLQELDRRLADNDARLAHLLREREERERLIRQLRESIAELPISEQQADFADRRGQLPWPADGPLRHAFGEPRELGDLAWEGVLIGSPEGEPVRAVHYGRVVFADWFGASGLLLIVDHGGGYMSLYAHNSELYSEVGDWVAGGEAVAAAGSSGGQAESGLYFEIRQDGRALDPVAWCLPR